MERALAAPQTVERRWMPAVGSRIMRWIGLLLGPFLIFAVFLLTVGADPIETYR